MIRVTFTRWGCLSGLGVWLAVVTILGVGDAGFGVLAALGAGGLAALLYGGRIDKVDEDHG